MWSSGPALPLPRFMGRMATVALAWGVGQRWVECCQFARTARRPTYAFILDPRSKTRHVAGRWCTWPWHREDSACTAAVSASW